jgi:acetyl-CoA acetyltransferase
MGISFENVAASHNITRAPCDAFAVHSSQKFAIVQKACKLKD